MQLKQKVSLLDELAVYCSLISRQFWRERGIEFQFYILTFLQGEDYQSLKILVFVVTSSFCF